MSSVVTQNHFCKIWVLWVYIIIIIIIIILIIKKKDEWVKIEFDKSIYKIGRSSGQWI
jgi:uncharacterized integral membrane protein